jgi:hypothetical protein
VKYICYKDIACDVSDYVHTYGILSFCIGSFVKTKLWVLELDDMLGTISQLGAGGNSLRNPNHLHMLLFAIFQARFTTCVFMCLKIEKYVLAVWFKAMGRKDHGLPVLTCI